jgi:hypothetical protein
MLTGGLGNTFLANGLGSQILIRSIAAAIDEEE